MPKKAPNPEAKAFDHALGVRLKSARTARGLTQKALAAELGITPQQIHKYEVGLNQVPLRLLLQIALVLQVSLTDLLPGSQLPETSGRLQLEVAADFAQLPLASREAFAQLLRAWVQEQGL